MGAKSTLNKTLFKKEFYDSVNLSPSSQARSAYHQIERDAELEARKRKAMEDHKAEEQAAEEQARKRRRLSSVRRQFLESKMSPEEVDAFEFMED